ncbi:hypothetical protein [Butyrivibrio sp. AE3006]|uniref:hypothetical protein n=1 Tax=Butyrivibrio sp. AE3006 TaxID=1280673 RepID=UPI000402BCE0|nr:hypothetical protein [Butyrivibrio sp. AE3006]
MKTLFIDCSPKKKLSASGFLVDMTSLFVLGNKKKMKLRTRAEHEEILKELEDTDTVVFTMPLYVDGVPSHIIPFLKTMEAWCKEHKPDLKVYVIANNGFIEGRQNEPLMQNMENFCIRSGIKWCGGLGIGGGVMMNVMRIMIVVVFAIAVLNLVITGMNTGNYLDKNVIVGFLKDLAEVLFFGCGIITFDIWLATCINRKKEYGKHYTRIMLPSFIFIFGADFFFIVLSILKGGVFRGWLSKKKPTLP